MRRRPLVPPLLLVAVMTLGFIALSPLPAAASHCGTASDSSLFGDTVKVRHVNCGHSDGDGVGGPVSGESRWATYCQSLGSYQEGNTVDISRGAQVTSGTSFTYYSLSFSGHVGTPTSIEQITVPTGVRYFNYSIACRTPSGVTVQNVILPEGAVPVSPIALRDEVKAKITIADPSLAGSPPLDETGRFSIVNLETWLWITDPWQPLTKSDARGGISVSVTATPTQVIWDTGDGETETCFDGGTPWATHSTEGGTQCSHTYIRSSAGEPQDAYQLTATVYWIFEWTLNGTPQGQFATYEPATTLTHQVGEILAVNTTNKTD